MPRTSADYDTRTRTARLRLPPRVDPYYRSAGVGKLLGYKRLNAESNGAWLVRTREAGRYTQRVIGQADDHTQADGVEVLNFETAMRFVVDPNAARKSAAGNVTVAQALTTYYDTMKSKHREAYRRLGTLHIVPELGGYRVDKLTKARINTWLNGMVKPNTRDDPDRERRSMETANRILSHLKAALTAAFDEEANGIPSDAAWRRVQAFEGTSKAREDHGLQPAKAAALIAAAQSFRPELANLIKAGFLTGARLGELCDATVGGFDPRGTLNVRGKTKSRPILLTAETTAFIAELAKGKPRNALLFPDQHGNRWPKAIQFGRQFAKAAKLAGLPYSQPKGKGQERHTGGVTFYTLRHAYISRSLENGVDTHVIARNCGTSAKMIEEHYEHISAERARDMLERGSTSLRVIEGGKRKRKAA